jgi:hypothetical protein
LYADADVMPAPPPSARLDNDDNDDLDLSFRTDLHILQLPTSRIHFNYHHDHHQHAELLQLL